MPEGSERVDETGLAFRGSMLQAQLYVNEHTELLNQGVLDSLPGLAATHPSITWVSPIKERRYKEYRDGQFLNELGLGERAKSLRAFWPARGPRWDALATLSFPGGESGVLLVEAKSYPGEMWDEAGCRATPESLKKIRAALAQTQAWLGVTKPVETWLGGYYQIANRLALLYWLNRELPGRAWLVHLLFTDDGTHAEHRSTTREAWEPALKTASTTLGITRPVPSYSHVFLPALPRPTVHAPE